MPVEVEVQLPQFFNIVDGQRVETTETFDVYNPASGALIARCPAAPPSLANKAVASAKAAFPKWRRTPLKERRAAFVKTAEIIEANAPFLTKLLTMEQGKPLPAAQWEIGACVDFLKHAATVDLPHEVVKDTDEELVEVVYQPLGVFVGIAPWNFPAVIFVLKLIDPVLCGNTVVIKPSPFTPLTSLAIADLIKDAFPPGVVNALAGGNELGALLTKHPDVAGVTFTGSVATGKAIARVCADGVKRLVLEMGGNDAAIVREDCDVDKAADGLFMGAFMNSGQVCCAIKRLYVHESKFEDVCARLVERAKTAKVGNGLEEGVQFGPINNRMQYERVKELLNDAIANGAKVLCGGMPDDSQQGNMFPLTLVTDVAEGVRLVDEEQFGPVLPIMKFSTDEEAIERANNSKFGLGSSVWGTDIKRAAEIARELQAGSGWVNQHGKIIKEAPFGGFKESGFGRECGKWGLKQFLEPQSVMVKKL